MKQRLSLFAAVLVLICVLSSAVLAADEDFTFTESEVYAPSKSFDKTPVTFEAWLYLPKSVSGRGGVILGNYGGLTSCVNVEIYNNGNPRFYYVDTDKTVHNYVFSGVDVRGEDWVHLAFVHDGANGYVHCYLNGVRKATARGATPLQEKSYVTPLYVGGDIRGGNVQFFKGALRSVSVYADIRTEDEIKADMQTVDTKDENLLVHYDLTKSKKGESVVDQSAAKNDARLLQTWIENKAPVTDYAYSFCFVGDTQKIAYNEPEKLSCIYDWIVENKEEKKISFVFGLGDITDKSTDAEWEVAKREISKLDGVVPYSLVRGNHDGSAAYNKNFSVPAYTQQFGGFYQSNKIENSWRTFTVADVDYLLITMDYGPSDAVLNWAAKLIEEYPNHRVIITTHCYLFRDGTTLDKDDVVPPNASGSNDGAKNNGDQMWDKLVSKYENIFLVVSGHDPCSNIIVAQDTGVHGNVVTQMLVDPQNVDASIGATGMVAMLYFSGDGKTVTIENYSTVHGKHYMSTSQMTIEVPPYVKKDIPAETTAIQTTEAETTAATTAADTTPQESAPAAAPAAPSSVPVASIVIGGIAAAAVIAVVILVIRKKKRA